MVGFSVDWLAVLHFDWLIVSLSVLIGTKDFTDPVDEVNWLLDKFVWLLMTHIDPVCVICPACSFVSADQSPPHSVNKSPVNVP